MDRDYNRYYYGDNNQNPYYSNEVSRWNGGYRPPSNPPQGFSDTAPEIFPMEMDNNPNTYPYTSGHQQPPPPKRKSYALRTNLFDISGVTSLPLPNLAQMNLDRQNAEALAKAKRERELELEREREQEQEHEQDHEEEQNSSDDETETQQPSSSTENNAEDNNEWNTYWRDNAPVRQVW
ncbi:hypothetical protein H4R33_003624 [Dimargaris cristalligena]|uniref:Uncharacterized protein n=1 Tax=Dimargaris cristalligena TaxID=215637 RepID=A0A4Q0A195_9FUNG|nr:hypothetical protein H4R33_003624 [Dimargaris cristalligena]RKP38910.1 hypothetical protein BJ085DRAFT_30893 [Dimargaris cristalligena]|eukprot:RKP38910.1 hypothetical protein BJ085DRAFT_30893 [Dimargaris cristalligena]